MSIPRYTEELQLSKAKELLRVESYDAALSILRPLWQKMSYRMEGWWDIVQDVTWSLRSAASKAGDGEAVLWADWELMSSTFQPKSEWTYDLAQSLKEVDVKEKPSVVIKEHDVHSFLSASFAFQQPDAKVADICVCQLTITSHASKVSAPVAISEIRIAFEGGLKPIIIHHESANDNQQSKFTCIDLSEADLKHDDSPELQFAVLQGKQDLTFAAGHTKVFEFSFLLREAGPARATSATFSITNDSFDLDYVVNFDEMVIPDTWWIQKESRKRLVRIDPYMIDIKPKPPKMDIRFVELYDQYYTNETIHLQLEMTNGEEEECETNLNVFITGEGAPTVRLSQQDRPATSDSSLTEHAQVEHPSGLSLGTIATTKSTLVNVEIPASDISAAYDLMVDLTYHLLSDEKTQINKTMSIRLFVVSPFEANYDFAPRYDPTPWPTFFRDDGAEGHTDNVSDDQKAKGIIQKWVLTSKYASFALTPLLVTDVSLALESLNTGITCDISSNAEFDPGTTDPSPTPTESDPIEIDPNAIINRKFTVTTQKLSLDDRKSASLDLTLAISWRRFPSDPDIPTPINTTHLAVPRLLVASQEPRVLLTTSPHPASTPQTPILTLAYTIENPSMHFLTFSTTMSPSEEFAFSGIKSGNLQLVPLSRRTVTFVVMPKLGVNDKDTVDGGVWIWPVFSVRDKYFQKVLRVAPGVGCRVSKDVEGVGVWVPCE